jgi:hypothetical protein
MKRLLVAVLLSSCGGVVLPPGPDAGDTILECAQNQCAIEGRCWAWEDVNPENECELCHVKFSRTEWYARDAVSCGDGGRCSRGVCR